jgi:GNAT superfamily N-acetyltransferase
LGKALLKHLAALAGARGCGRFEWSVLDWNASAIAFYQRMGAQVMPDWRICRVTGEALTALGQSDF